MSGILTMFGGGGSAGGAAAKAPVLACGFQCGQVNSGLHWTGSGGVFSNVIARSGDRSMRFVFSPGSGTITSTVAANLRTVGRFYVYFVTVPNADTFLAWASTTTSMLGIGYRISDGKMYCGSTSSITFATTTGVAVKTGQWYRVDFTIDQTSGARTIDAQVDGVSLSQASNAGAAAAGAFNLGTPVSLTGEWYIADFIMSNTASDYPFGQGAVDHYVPISDGSHNTGAAGSFIVGSAGANITNATTTSFGLIDDVPLDDTTPDTNDYITQTNDTGGGSLYVEHVFGPAPDIPAATVAPRIIDVVLGRHQAAAAAGNSTFKLNDNGTEDTIDAFNGTGSTSTTYARKGYATAPSDGLAWRITSGNGNLNNLRHRFGYSTDGNPDQSLDCVMLEVEFPGPFGTATDEDAQRFLRRTAITDATIVSAVDQLVKDLKTAGVWRLCDAIYPFVGGTAALHKWNLKDPRNLDAAFRGIFSGTVTHDANGITPNGTTGYMDTKYNGSTAGRNNDSHVSVYVRTNTAAGDKTEINAYNGVSGYWGIKCRDTGDVTFNGIYRFTSDGFISVASNTDARGFYTLTRRSSSDAQAYKNGSSTGTTTTSSQAIPSANVHIGKRSDTTTSFTDRNIAFASIGRGLTTGNVSDLYTAVQAFQTTLGRQV